jgi:hypothetical protein
MSDPKTIKIGDIVAVIYRSDNPLKENTPHLGMVISINEFKSDLIFEIAPMMRLSNANSETLGRVSPRVLWAYFWERSEQIVPLYGGIEWSAFLAPKRALSIPVLVDWHNESRDFVQMALLMEIQTATTGVVLPIRVVRGASQTTLITEKAAIAELKNLYPHYVPRRGITDKKIGALTLGPNQVGDVIMGRGATNKILENAEYVLGHLSNDDKLMSRRADGEFTTHPLISMPILLEKNLNYLYQDYRKRLKPFNPTPPKPVNPNYGEW